MTTGQSRDFKIGGRTYRDTQLGRDVHQISNPATGHVYGEVVQIPAEGRTKAYYLAGPERERAETWAEAVQAARAQNPDPVVSKVFSPPPTPQPEPPLVLPTPVPAPTLALDAVPDSWVTVVQAAERWNVPWHKIRNLIYHNRATVRGRKIAGGPNGRGEWRIDPIWIESLIGPPSTLAPEATRPRKATRKPAPPVEAAPVAAAEVMPPPESKVTVRPAGTKVRELETQLAELQTRVDAMEAARSRQSWLTRLFGGS